MKVLQNLPCRRWPRWGLIGLSGAVSLVLAFPAVAAEIAEGQDPPGWLEPQTPVYDATGKADPFQSFVRQEEAQVQRPQRAEPQRPLTPLEKVAVSQLRLVGVIVRPGAGETPLAMVELPDGKGFLVRPGTRIGRNQGEVVAITSKAIMVQETVVDVFGEEKERTVTLKLHPSSGENDGST